MVNNYYQKHKEKIWKEARERYKNIFEEGKNIRQRKAQERYQDFTEEEKEKRCNKNLSEEQKKKLAEYSGNYYLPLKNKK